MVKRFKSKRNVFLDSKINQVFNTRVDNFFGLRNKKVILALIAMLMFGFGLYLSGFSQQTAYAISDSEIGINQIGDNLTINVNPSNEGVLKFIYVYKEGQDKEQDIINLPNGYIVKKDYKVSYPIPASWFGRHYVAIYSYSKNDWVKAYFDV